MGMYPAGKPQATSLRVPPEDLDQLEQLAARLGFFQPRGPGSRKKVGNISALIRAIARGDFVLTPAHAEDKRTGDVNRPT